MERMIIKHSSGSKANQVEEFPLHHYSELVLGRDNAATVRYDADKDDLVGRQHAKISRDPDNENGFLIEDTSSRNGTFLNGQKLTGPQSIQPGDRVQLGTGGPEFTFDVEPRPAGSIKATRIADSMATNAPPPTRVADEASVATAAGSKTTVGKATVERMISSTVTETKKQEGKKYATIGGIAAVVILLLGGIAIGGVYWYNSRQQAALQSELASKSAQLESQTAEAKSRLDAGGIGAAEISDKYGKSVVFIQGSWQLINKETKSLIYHQFMPNSRELLGALLKQNYGKGPIIPDGGNAIPLYVKTEVGYEPLLTDKATELTQPIGGSGYTCTGFIVTTDGFILTNRHCSSPWKSQYHFPGNYPQGIVIAPDGSIAGAGVQPPGDWIPDNTKSVARQYQVSGTGASKFDGQQKLTIMLPGSDTQIEAQKIADSVRHDVAMLKISVPGNLPKVELYDADSTLKKGDSLVIMGYPGGASEVYAPIKSRNFLNAENKFTIIPDPTVSVTTVGNIVKEVEAAEAEKVRMSDRGDSIRYAQNLTWGGNSGGPVFDMQGRVIAIHFAGYGGGGSGGPAAGIGVPIKYGLQLFPGGASQ